ncbi:MAG TPA: UrcA family protein [Gammaproteobacteria bacterium]|nr:UrcA family protein [Gammaproteobacteria bacterium]
MNARRNASLYVTAATLATSLFSSPPALAEPTGNSTAERISRSIDASGLDLSSASGAERLYREIVATATVICRGGLRHYKGVARVRHEHEHVRPCIEQAVGGALAQVADATGLDLKHVAGLDRPAQGALSASR